MTGAEGPPQAAGRRCPGRGDRRRAAEGVLGRAWGGPVRLGPPQAPRRRPVALDRCALPRAPHRAGRRPASSPSASGGAGAVQEGYDPDDAGPGRPAGRLLTEWAATRFLSGLPGLGGSPPRCAAVYGADRAAGVVVFEVLGPGACLADLLQGDDPARAEAGLLAYARALGELRRPPPPAGSPSTPAARAAVGAPPDARPPAGGVGGEDVPRFRAASAAAGVGGAPRRPGRSSRPSAPPWTPPAPSRAFAPGDTCPDNHRFAGDVRAAPAGPALLRLRVRRLPPRPAGRRLPGRPLPHLLVREPPPGGPAAPPAGRLPRRPGRGLPGRGRRRGVRGRATWPPGPPGPSPRWAGSCGGAGGGPPWGISSLRPRHLLRLDTFAGAAERSPAPARPRGPRPRPRGAPAGPLGAPGPRCPSTRPSGAVRRAPRVVPHFPASPYPGGMKKTARLPAPWALALLLLTLGLLLPAPAAVTAQAAAQEGEWGQTGSPAGGQLGDRCRRDGGQDLRHRGLPPPAGW